MLRESQLSTRNMVTAVTEEFWKMVRGSINDQALHFKTLRYNLEAEWRNRYPGGRTLDRDDLFELGKADILTEVASLQVLPPNKWEMILSEGLWDRMAPKVLDIFMAAAQGRSPGEFNTSADIQLHKWADSQELAKLCTEVGLETMFEQLHTKLEDGGEGGANRFHSLSQGLREEIERLGRTQHQWEGYNVDQLKYVQMSALDDKDVQTAEQWEAAVQFMSSSLKKQIRVAEEEMQRMEGPTSYYDRWIRWKGQNELEIKRQAVANELNNFLRAEPSHPNKLYADEVMTVQRVLKTNGYSVSEEDVQYVWERVYDLHFLREAEEVANKCQWGFNLRHHSTEYTCSEVEFFWRVEQVIKSSARTLRVQILDREVRQLEQQVKTTLDSIAGDEGRKREVIRGDAVDKAEQLKQVRMIQEKLDTFREALKTQQRD
ncbi:dynamin-like 120 kDa protein, mitochondrial [Halichondria panicea]